jgi:hypothetical protein
VKIETVQAHASAERQHCPKNFVQASKRLRTNAALQNNDEAYFVLYGAFRPAMLMLTPLEWAFTAANAAAESGVLKAYRALTHLPLSSSTVTVWAGKR